ncbi:MAG TPA: sigma-54 dependent transcriptional regulator [Verrucomicrobiae bacterium]|jgi:two-component system, NtrC family, response regulator AtoC|nr:sigma-54 dependent transcriptional regulator [Verrucomicrobiae bacterium]
MAERILIAEDDEDLAFVLREALIRKDYEVDVAPTAGRMLDTLKTGAWDLILLDVRLPDMDGLDAIPKCRDVAADTPIIVMTAHGTREVATEAVSRGAYDFFTKPLKMTEFQVVVARALERRRLQLQIKALQAAQGTGFEELVGKSESLKRVVEMAQRAAPADVTVLIEGESGTGKEVLARAIHRLSSRKDGPIIPVNCAAIPEGLLESELFGHERGAFTGAVRAKPGRFELAREGTIFLDEIGDMPLAMQVKILRALQEREIERVGGTKSIPIDVRVIAATHQNLDTLVAEGKFRADLFYRLQGVRLRLPPLRERVDDLPDLITHLLDRTARRMNRLPATVSTEALRALWAYGWPGNVRELQHVLEGAMVMSDGVILPVHLPPAIQQATAQPPAAAAPVLAGPLDEALETWERQMILDALRQGGGIQARAAKILGISERSLWYRVKKLGIQVRTQPEA